MMLDEDGACGMPDHYDVIIIGSGAGGGTLASALADTGKSILILERGEELPVEDDNWSPSAVFIQRKYRTRETWLDKAGKPFIPNTHYWVGGNTTFYGAALMRMKTRDFEEVTHAGGVSPAWPIRYEDIAPWYQKAGPCGRSTAPGGSTATTGRTTRPIPSRRWPMIPAFWS